MLLSSRIAFIIDAVVTHESEHKYGHVNEHGHVVDPWLHLVSQWTWDAITSTADQGHDVIVLTNHPPDSDIFASHPRIQVLQVGGSSSWSWLNLPHIMAVLLQWQPQIIHIIQSPYIHKKNFPDTMGLLAKIKTELQRKLRLDETPKLLLSFFDLNRDTKRQYEGLLQNSDAIILTQAQQKEFCPRGHAELILPMDFSSLVSSPSNSSAVSDRPILPAALKPTLAVPGPISQHQDPLFLFEILISALHSNSQPHITALMMGGWGNTSIRMRHQIDRMLIQAKLHDRVYFSGPLHPHEELQLLKSIPVIWAATLKPATLSFAFLLEQLRHLTTSPLPRVILSEAQWSARYPDQTQYPGHFLIRPLEKNSLSWTLQKHLDNFSFSPHESITELTPAACDGLQRLNRLYHHLSSHFAE